MKPVERNSPNNGDCLTWDDGTPLTTNEGKAWWSGWEEGNADGIADMQDVMREEIERLREALGNVSRMKVFPDPQINQFTLATAIQIACAALGEGKE